MLLDNDAEIDKLIGDYYALPAGIAERGGFYVVDGDSLERAQAIAAGIPTARFVR